jgi:TonB family protein
MFGTLFESRARRQRRTGGAALSVAAHIAIIGAATAATVHGRPAHSAPPKPLFVTFTLAAKPKPMPAERSARASSASTRLAAVPAAPTLTIGVPLTVPTSLPSFDLTSFATPTAISIGRASGLQNGHSGSAIDLGEATPSGNEWRGRELLMHIISQGKPRYPEVLRQSGIDGHVLVQFVVDTAGYVDMRSVKFINSSHDLFTQAVRNALPSFRFKPAEVNGQRTAALAEMPFEFEVKR